MQESITETNRTLTIDEEVTLKVFTASYGNHGQAGDQTLDDQTEKSKDITL